MALENVVSQEIVQRLGWTLLHFVWQATGVALLLGVMLVALRRSTANVRYIVACAALGLTVLLPIVTMTLVPASTSQPIANIELPPAPAVVPVQPTIVETPVARDVEAKEPVQIESVDIAPAVSWKQRATETLEVSLPYLVTGWLVGVFGLSLWHLGGWAQLQRLKRQMVTPVDVSLHATLNELAAKLRVHRAVRLVESALVQVPTVVGWLRPVILLPASALTGLTTEQLEALLAHELAHIRRYDYLVNMLQTVVETLGFYHPGVWWISHKIRLERENCCDDLAVGLSGDRIRYARALTSMEEIRASRSELAVAASGGNLFGRIRRLIGKNASDSNRAGWIPSVITILLIAIIAIPTSIALNNDVRIKDQKGSIAPNKVVLKLADPNSQPVVGARVGTSVEWSDTGKNPPIWFLRDGGTRRKARVKSDKSGKVTLGTGDVFWSVPPTEQKAPIVALDEDHSLAALQELLREDLGTEVTLTLQPACRVHGRLTAAAARKRQLSPNNLNVLVYWRVHTPCQSASKQGRFDFVLPPGEYKLRFFSNYPNNSFTLPILIKPGQRDLDLTGYLDGTSKLPKTKTNKRDREGSIEPNKVVLKLADPNSQPVVGAWVGTYVDWSDIAESPPIWFLKDGGSYKASEIDSAAKVISNKEGKITLTEEELFKPYWPTEKTVPLTAIDEGHYLAGLRELSREDLGTEVTLTLQPGCRVHGRVSAATARKHKWSTKVLTVLVFWHVHWPCQYSSREGRFEFVLPPGKYEVQVYAEDPDNAINLPILIKPGQRDLDLTKYLDGTRLLPAVETESPAERDEGRIEGRIIDINTGRGISGAQLAVVPRFSRALYDRFVCTSGEDGTFAIDGLNSGEYLIQGDFPSLDVAVTAGQCTRDVLIGVNRRDALQAPKETTTDVQTDVKIKIGLRVIEMPADVMKEAFEPDESLSSELLVRNGYEIADRLLTLTEERIDAKLIANPQLLMVNNGKATVMSSGHMMYISGYESAGGEPSKLTPQHKMLEAGWKYTFHAGILESGKKVHIELVVCQQKLAFETRQHRPGYDYQIPSPPEIFVTEMTAKNGEPVAIGRLRRGETAFCLIVTPSVIMPEPQPESLLGKKLPVSDNIQGADRLKETGKQTLICFWDMNQRPSRNMITELAKRVTELQNQDVAVFLVHTSDAEPAKLKEWLEENNIPFACGSIKSDAKEVLFRWGVQAQPWLVLIDEQGVVTAGGFGLESLTPEGLDELAEKAKPRPHIFKLFNLKHVQPEKMAESLKRILKFRTENMIAPAFEGASIEVVPDASALLVPGELGNSQWLTDLLVVLDVPPHSQGPIAVEDAVLIIYQVAHVDHEQLAELLQSLLTDDVVIKAVLDQPAKKILGRAGKSDHERIQKLIRLLDRPPGGPVVEQESIDLGPKSGIVFPKGFDELAARKKAATRAVNGPARQEQDESEAATDAQRSYREILEDLQRSFREKIEADKQNRIAELMDSAHDLQHETDAKAQFTVDREYETVQLGYADAGEMVGRIEGTLRQMPDIELGKNVLLQPLERARQIIIFGRKDVREIVKKLIAPLDTTNDKLEIKVVQLKYIDPDQMRERIEGSYAYPPDEPQETVRVISWPAMKQVTVIASPENMSRIAKQIAEWDVFQVFKPRIIKLQNSDPVQMARLLTTLFAEEDEEGVNIRNVILGEDAEEKYNLVGPLSSHFTFEDVPGTNRIIVISNTPKAYEAVVSWILELDQQKIASKDVKQVREWMAGLAGGARPKTPKAIGEVEQSSHQMKLLGLALALYAKEHDGTLAETLSQVKPYVGDDQDFNWMLENVEYSGRGRTTQQNAARTPIAYDRTMLEGGVETNVLFLDFSVRLLNRKQLDELAIGKTPILIETKVLMVGDAFMKHVGLDPNSVASSEGWSDHLVQASGDSANFVIDPLHADLLIKAAAAHEDSTALIEPRVSVLDGKKVTFHVPDPSRPGVSAPADEPNRSSGESESKTKRVEYGSTLRLAPNLTPDGKTVYIGFDWERRRLLGFRKHTGPDKLTQKIPQVAVDSVKTLCPVPDGKTLLIAGKKITEKIEILSEVPLLRDLPLVGWLFSSPTTVEQTRHLLILVKPVVAPEKKAQARRVPEPPPLDPDDPLIKKLEENLEQSDEQR